MPLDRERRPNRLTTGARTLPPGRRLPCAVHGGRRLDDAGGQRRARTFAQPHAEARSGILPSRSSTRDARPPPRRGRRCSGRARRVDGVEDGRRGGRDIAVERSPGRAAGAPRGSRRPWPRSRGRRGGAALPADRQMAAVKRERRLDRGDLARHARRRRRPVPRPTQSLGGRRRKARDRSPPRWSCCRCPSRRCREGRCRRRSPPCRRPSWRRRPFSSMRRPRGDVAGRHVEGEVEDLEAEVVGAQIWLIAAPPAAKFSSICRVTSGGIGARRPAATTP